jgi:capsular polysaccharide export protein
MSVLFLQSPYSYLFRDIALELQKRNIHVYVWGFNLGDKLIYKGLPVLDVHKKINKYLKSAHMSRNKIDEMKNVRNYYTEKVRKIYKRDLNMNEVRYFVAYKELLKEFISENNVEMIIMQNDTRWQHDLAISVANEVNIKYLVFELGLFRPNTITIDHKGVNYNNSVPRKKDFYLNYNVKPNNELKEVKINISGSRIKRDLLVSRYIINYTLGKLLNKNSIDNKHLKISEYVSRFVKSYLSKKQQIDMELPQRYVFVPFQVNDDSQILVHSDYNNMTEFVEDVIQGVDNYNKQFNDNLSIVFKEHPMDIGKTNYRKLYNKYQNRNDILFLKWGDTNELIKKAEVVITVNSTVGLEAIQLYKPVICMGRSFYCIDGLATFSTRSNLSKTLKNVLSSDINKQLIDRFIAYLKNEYQFTGDEYFYNLDVIKNITNYIVESINNSREKVHS